MLYGSVKCLLRECRELNPQCCWNTVARSPNANHVSTGWPKVLPWMVRLVTNAIFRFCKKIFRNESGDMVLMSIFGMVWAMFYQTSRKAMIEIYITDSFGKIKICRNIIISHFNRFYGLSNVILLNNGPPRIESDHQNIHHRWSDERPEILHFLQHCTPIMFY